MAHDVVKEFYVKSIYNYGCFHKLNCTCNNFDKMQSNNQSWERKCGTVEVKEKTVKLVAALGISLC